MALKSRVVTLNLSGTVAAQKVVWRAPYACKVSAVRGYRVAGTGAVVKAIKNATDLTSANLSLTSADTWMTGTLSSTAATLKLAAGDTLKLEIVSVAGAPTDVVVQVDVTRNADAG